ncbi:MAG: DNA-directed RNA polymerase subunit omega [Candidatus Delongbacteria bacterium]|nr:DNA-directed RNA polymerase subunit omega [Candidatus Delongbacteria bacterium]
MKDFIPLDILGEKKLNPFELVIAAAKEARNINKVRIVEKEKNPELKEETTADKVYIEALNKIISGEVEFYY